tara:strand:- start:931 stop:1908 length:978 start_codon:yes stop_codon:yes gene_type:complete
MILKFYELNKINFALHKIILFYGQNEGFKNETINKLLKDNSEISIYDEREILENSDIFLENLFSKSLFETNKKILIKRATDKIVKILDEITKKNLDDTTIILNAGNLEKKSKLRTLFEKNKEYICVAFYPDTTQILSQLSLNYFKDKNISISQSNINLVISKCNGDRSLLISELNKIEYFIKNGKKLSNENISKLINLSENHSISELIDNCLAKNKKKTINILNDNNFNNEDCVLITRVFLNKAIKILRLSEQLKDNKNIDLTISSAKPPIFWKDKEIIKTQLLKWKPEGIKNLIYNLSEIELLIKKNINNGVRLTTDFILKYSS